jgi:hypothetical protein
MSYLVYELGALSGRHELARLATFEEAEAHVMALDPICYERDADYPGCADAFLKSGLIVHITKLP